MDRIPMTDDEIYRCEQYAADDEAEVRYQEMMDQETYLAELEAASIEAERAYQQMIQA
jgi:hypothetical protein